MPQQLLLPRKSISNGFTLNTKLFKILSVLSLFLLFESELYPDSLSVHSALSNTGSRQNEPLCLWQRSAASGNLPSWFKGDQDGERGLALFNDKLYIVSRSIGTSVQIIDAKTGQDNGSLPMDAIIKGGTYLLNDIEADSSGNLFACNLAATPKSRNFKIYHWKNSSSKPELFLSYSNPLNLRLGDHFSLSGNINTRADIYAAAAGTDKVIHWVIKRGKVSPPQVLTFSSLPNCGSAPYFAPLSDGNFLLNANSLTPRLFDAKNELSGAVSDQVIPTGSTVFKQIVSIADTIFLFYLSKPAEKNGQSIRAVRWNGSKPEKLTTADILFTTPPLGSNINSNFVGDIAFTIQNNHVEFYLLATNNGLAAYSYQLKEIKEIKPEKPLIPEVIVLKPETQITDTAAIKATVKPEIIQDSIKAEIILPSTTAIPETDTLKTVAVKPEIIQDSIKAEIILPSTSAIPETDTLRTVAVKPEMIQDSIKAEIILPSTPAIPETDTLKTVTNTPQLTDSSEVVISQVAKEITPPVLLQYSLSESKLQVPEGFSDEQTETGEFKQNSQVGQPAKKESPYTVFFKSGSAQVAGFMVFNIRGDLVFSKQQFVMAGRNSFTIPFKNWKRGVYLYKIILDDRIISGKAVNTK